MGKKKEKRRKWRWEGMAKETMKWACRNVKQTVTSQYFKISLPFSTPTFTSFYVFFVKLHHTVVTISVHMRITFLTKVWWLYLYPSLFWVRKNLQRACQGIMGIKHSSACRKKKCCYNASNVIITKFTIYTTVVYSYILHYTCVKSWQAWKKMCTVTEVKL